MFRLSRFMEALVTGGEVPPRRAPPGPVVIWNVIRRCNLTCRHCYSLSNDTDFKGELSTEEALAVLDERAQVGALDELEQQPHATLFDAGVEEAHHVDVLDHRHRLALLAEAELVLLGLCPLGPGQLERAALALRHEHLEHLGGVAGAEPTKDPVLRDVGQAREHRCSGLDEGAREIFNHPPALPVNGHERRRRSSVRSVRPQALWLTRLALSSSALTVTVTPLALPSSGPALPVSPAALTVNGAVVPVTPSTRPVNVHLVPVTVPGLTVTPQLLPVRPQGRPVNAHLVSLTVPLLPVTVPLVPVSVPALTVTPHHLPGAPQGLSVTPPAGKALFRHETAWFRAVPVTAHRASPPAELGWRAPPRWRPT